MVVIKIWQRYFIREFLKTLIFFLVCFYGLYVLIDYSNHSTSFHRHQVSFQIWEVMRYYFWEFVNRLEVLLPFAILIATVNTLCSLNVNNELVALMSSGISLHKLMRPFLILGLFFTCLMYANTQTFLPGAMTDLKRIHDTRKSLKHKNDRELSVQYLALEDNSTIIFQNYNTAEQRFFDAYWIRSIDDIYRIKYLYPQFENSTSPVGLLVDHLKRNSNNELVVTESSERMEFPIIQFNKETLFETIMQPDEHSVTELWEKLPQAKDDLSEKEAELLSTFYRKLAMPWLCFLAVIAPAPLCMRFTRHLPVFLIYSLSIFGLVAFYLIMNSAALLGEKQVINPFFAIWTPFALFFSFFSYRFAFMR